MPSPAEQARVLRGLSALTKRDLEAIWRKLNLDRPDRLAEPLAVILEEITAKYGSAAATLAAEWYDEARAAAGVAGSFRAAPALLPEPSRFESLARWGVGPMFGGDGPDAALQLLLGGLSRQVLNMARDTTAGNVALDPAGPRYARHASANACAFCAMLATRGADYTSEDAALRVVGRGKERRTGPTGRRAGGIRPRGTRALGEKYHDDCHCTAVAVFPGQEYQEAPYVAKWREAYADTSSNDRSVILAEMREALSTN